MESVESVESPDSPDSPDSHNYLEVMICVGSSKLPVGKVPEPSMRSVRVGGARMGRDSGAEMIPVAVTRLIRYPWQLEPRSPSNVNVTLAPAEGSCGAEGNKFQEIIMGRCIMNGDTSKGWDKNEKNISSGSSLEISSNLPSAATAKACIGSL